MKSCAFGDELCLGLAGRVWLAGSGRLGGPVQELFLDVDGNMFCRVQ